MIDCVENRLITSRRGLLLGGASFAAWAYCRNSRARRTVAIPG